MYKLFGIVLLFCSVIVGGCFLPESNEASLDLAVVAATATEAPATVVAPTAAPQPTVAPQPTAVPQPTAAPQPTTAPASDAADTTFLAEGEASRISDNFQGQPMANGEPYNKDALTASHKDLALGTKVRVTNLSNQQSVDVIITDRIPAQTQQVIDVTRAAAQQLGMPDMGTAMVRIEVIE